jgi:hypothetical protein
MWRQGCDKMAGTGGEAKLSNSPRCESHAAWAANATEAGAGLFFPPVPSWRRETDESSDVRDEAQWLVKALLRRLSSR